jgi:hypothetical protein
VTPAERERIRIQVVDSRRRQGFPDHVTDPTLLAELAAVVVGAGVEEGGADAVA